jgi:hypothetical protein
MKKVGQDTSSRQSFHLGGYRSVEKWLKDRRDRQSFDDHASSEGDGGMNNMMGLKEI